MAASRVASAVPSGSTEPTAPEPHAAEIDVSISSASRTNPRFIQSLPYSSPRRVSLGRVPFRFRIRDKNYKNLKNPLRGAYARVRRHALQNALARRTGGCVCWLEAVRSRGSKCFVPNRAFRQHYPEPQHEEPQRWGGGPHRAPPACLAGGDTLVQAQPAGVSAFQEQEHAGGGGAVDQVPDQRRQPGGCGPCRPNERAAEQDRQQ